MTGTRIASLSFSSWPQLVGENLGVDEWLWIDLYGVHRSASLPEKRPQATHVWGWGISTWVRLRLDVDGSTTGARLVGSDIESIGTRCWPAGDKRVGMNGPSSDALRDAALALVQARGHAQLTFVNPAHVSART